MTATRLKVLCFVAAAALVSISEAFVVTPKFAVARYHASSALFAGESDREGGAAIAKPKIKTDIKTETKQKQKQQKKEKVRTGDPISRRKEDFEDAPMFKVMLLGDDAYDLGHVVERICAIMEDVDEDMAANVFQQAQQEGKAMCGKYPLEHAEMYKEQLIRSDPMIFTDIEEEN